MNKPPPKSAKSQDQKPIRIQTVKNPYGDYISGAKAYADRKILQKSLQIKEE